MFNEDKEIQKIDELGEFGLIDHITKNVKIRNASTKLGIGDDAAIVNMADSDLVITTDMLVEGVHFDMVYTPLKHLGYKAVVVNVSDIYAMNAQPRQITVSLAISSKYSVGAVEEIYDGIRLAAERYGVDVIGGDTTSSLSGLVISITAVGEVAKGQAVTRAGAKENDLVVLSGDVGGAYIGLTLLQQEKEVWKVNPNSQPDFTGKDYVLERQLKPEARKDIVALLKQLGVVPTSMIDVSDGVSSEVMHLCKHSAVGCNIYEEKLPIDPTTYQSARDFNLDPTMCALNGGEDYELLFTISQDDFDKIKGNPNLTVIGHITTKESGLNLITSGGSVTPLKAQGWDGLKK
ncbi:MAG: thiamine-phosphate kinase [Flavobacteriales bacterium]|jgi:thiamine-monophosphate kinase|nr:thiamine-phosphate kinase [Flavobacteriales bacterium]